jgi:hypothetical protein
MPSKLRKAADLPTPSGSRPLRMHCKPTGHGGGRPPTVVIGPLAPNIDAYGSPKGAKTRQEVPAGGRGRPPTGTIYLTLYRSELEAGNLYKRVRRVSQQNELSALKSHPRRRKWGRQKVLYCAETVLMFGMLAKTPIRNCSISANLQAPTNLALL